MDATMILIDSDRELARARALMDRLWTSNDPADIARLEAQAQLIAAYEARRWPRRPTSTAELRGRKELSMAMVQRLRARFRVPADLLLPPPKKVSIRRAAKRAA